MPVVCGRNDRADDGTHRPDGPEDGNVSALKDDERCKWRVIILRAQNMRTFLMLKRIRHQNRALSSPEQPSSDSADSTSKQDEAVVPIVVEALCRGAY